MSSFSSDNSSSLPRLGGVGRGVPKYFLNISSSESINYGSISGSSHASYVHKGPGGEAQRVAEESGKNVVVVTTAIGWMPVFERFPQSIELPLCCNP